MKILVSYRGIPQSPGWATGDMVVKAFRALGHETYPYAKYYQENKWVEGKPNLDEHEWDLILFMECNDGDPQYPELKITRARKTACWLFDTSYYEDQCRYLVNYFRFDHIFLANPLSVQHYKVLGYNNVHYLPYACDSELHARSLVFSKTRDVSIIGSIRDDRKQLARQLESAGIKVDLVADHFREDYINALASSKIIINQNPPQGRGLLNMRYWETQAAGSCLLTDEFDCSSQPIDTSYVATYNSIEQIVSSCRYFLSNPDDMNEYIRYSQDHVLESHTYKNRCEYINENIGIL